MKAFAMGRILFAAAILLVLAACGGSAASPTVRALQTASTTNVAQAAATTAVTTIPTITPNPTPTPTVVPTPSPTPTPIPTPSPTPTPTPQPTPTPVPPTPTPQPTEAQLKAQYRGDVDVRDLYKDVAKYHDWKLTYAGTVLTIYSDSTSGTLVQVKVAYGSGILDTKVIDLHYDPSVDVSGIYENSSVVVWGYPISMFTITNSYGGQVSQPLLGGDYITLK